MWISIVALTFATAPVKVALPDFSAIDVEPRRAALVADHLAAQLAHHGLEVVTARQIAAVLGQERQAQLLGCSNESSSCLTELANAMGADVVASGTIAKIDDQFQLNVTLSSTVDARRISTLVAQGKSESAILDAITNQGNRVANDVLSRLRPGESSGTTDGTVRRWSWAPAAAGIGCGVAAAVLLANAGATSARLRSGVNEAGAPLTSTEGSELVSAGRSQQAAGVGLLIGAGASLVATAAMFLLGGADAPTVGLAPAAGGASLAIQGAFP